MVQMAKNGLKWLKYLKLKKKMARNDQKWF